MWKLSKPIIGDEEVRICVNNGERQIEPPFISFGSHES